MQRKQLTVQDLKQMVFQINPSIHYSLNEQGIITIIRIQNHPIQNFLRKLSFNIPQKTYLDLDKYGSFIVQQIDGKKSVYEIGQLLKNKFSEANENLYDRLVLYLHHLDVNEHIIQLINY